MSKSDSPLWTPPPHPEWLRAMNQEGAYFNLAAVVPLDEASLIEHAPGHGTSMISATSCGGNRFACWSKRWKRKRS